MRWSESYGLIGYHSGEDDYFYPTKIINNDFVKNKWKKKNLLGNGLQNSQLLSQLLCLQHWNQNTKTTHLEDWCKDNSNNNNKIPRFVSQQSTIYFAFIIWLKKWILFRLLKVPWRYKTFWTSSFVHKVYMINACEDNFFDWSRVAWKLES